MEIVVAGLDRKQVVHIVGVVVLHNFVDRGVEENLQLKN